MEICERNSMFALVGENNDELEFSHVKYILRNGDQYYYALSSHYYGPEEEIDISGLDPRPIMMSKIWPPYPAQFTRAPEPLPDNCYVKRPALIYCDETEASVAGLSSLILHEAEVCEILRAFPHPNIVPYLGCVVQNDSITGLAFVRYGMTLSEKVRNESPPFDVKVILQGIENGIRHLHSLDLIHCDINPTNILMDEDTPIITDFDSCHRNGQKLGLKSGTFGWTNQEFEFAKPQNDEYGLAKIREFLVLHVTSRDEVQDTVISHADSEAEEIQDKLSSDETAEDGIQETLIPCATSKDEVEEAILPLTT